MYRWKLALQVFLALVLVALLGWGCYAAIAWRGTDTIIVEDRWWTSSTLVQYDAVDIDVTIDEDENTTISTSTTTITRCRNHNMGRELPINYPPPSCMPEGGDYITYRQGFHIRYHIQESSQEEYRSFIPSLWDQLAPGTEVRASWGILQTITEVADAKSQ